MNKFKVMLLQNYLFILLFLTALSFFTYNILRIRSYLLLGRKENRFENIGQRIKKVLSVGIGQTKILREPSAGLMHAFIFWGFLVLLTAVIEAFIEGVYSGFSLTILGRISKVIFISQDLFGLLVVLSIIYALFRRYVLHPKRLQGDGNTNSDAAFILLMILGVMITMFGVNSAKIVLQPEYISYYRFHFISSSIAPMYSISSAAVLYSIFWWGHVIIVLFFLNYLPYSKHFHVITSLPNVYLSKLGPQTLDTEEINFEKEEVDRKSVV